MQRATTHTGNLCDLLITQAATRPTQPAIIDRYGRSISFADLEAATARGAALLARHDLGIDRRVLLLVPISIELYIALLSVMRVGATAVLLDPSAGLSHMHACCDLARPDAMIGVPKAHLLRVFSSRVRAIRKHFVMGTRLFPGISWSKAASLAPLAGAARCTLDSPALLTFTSGSTGQPKAALRSHGLLLAQQSAISRALHNEPGSAELITLPVFVLANLAAGVTSVIADADLRRPGSINPAPVLEQIRARSIASIVASPALMERLCAEPASSISPPPSLASVRRIFTGGAPVFPRLLDRLARHAPNARVVALYGSTEAEPIAHLEHAELTDDMRGRIRSGAGLPAGTPVADVTLRIIRDTWGTPLAPMSTDELNSCTQASAAIGEIVVTGAHVLKGYLNGVGDHETKFRVRDRESERVWHRTGDAGYLDPDGSLWLVGRASAKIADKHGVIYPLQVEAAALEHESVRRAALVAHAWQRVLLVEAAAGANVEAMRDELAATLAWAHVERIVVVPRIPMDRRHNAKVDYTALRALLATLPAEWSGST